MKFIVTQRFNLLTTFVVHFGLIHPEKIGTSKAGPKDQGGESLVGGLFINAAPFEWSIRIIDGNLRFGRYQMPPKRR